MYVFASRAVTSLAASIFSLTRCECPCNVCLCSGAPGKGVEAVLKRKGREKERVIVTSYKEQQVEQIRQFLVKAHLGCTLTHENIYKVRCVDHGALCNTLGSCILTRLRASSDAERFGS